MMTGTNPLNRQAPKNANTVFRRFPPGNRASMPVFRNTGQKQNTGYGLREEVAGIPDKIPDGGCRGLPIGVGDGMARRMGMMPS
jgi:hypothetical protein